MRSMELYKSWPSSSFSLSLDIAIYTFLPIITAIRNTFIFALEAKHLGILSSSGSKFLIYEVWFLNTQTFGFLYLLETALSPIDNSTTYWHPSITCRKDCGRYQFRSKAVDFLMYDPNYQIVGIPSSLADYVNLILATPIFAFRHMILILWYLQ